MNVNSEENSEESKEISNIDISKNCSKQKCLSNKKKRNKKNKNIASKSNNFGGILSEIKQINIPQILVEKENLFKILQSEIVNIDKGIDLLNKKKKYYDEIIQKLGDEIQKEKKDNKIIENKNKEYIYMENLLKDIGINDTFENNLLNDNSYYNKSKLINESLDYNYFLLNQKNNKNFLIINFFEEKNISKINNKMEPNYQMSYEEFNNIEDMDDNFCILMNEEMNKIKDDNNSDNKKDEDNNKEQDKIIIDDESERNENNLNLVDNTPIKINQPKEKEEFTIINEAPAEEEDTNNKKRKKNSINAVNDIDKSIKKDYSNSVEELDFYLLKNSNKIDKKEKKKKTIEDIQKKYKVQDMGSDFLPSDSSSLNLDNSKEEKIKKKKKKKNKKTKKESDINSNSSDIIQIDDKENNKSEDNIDEEDNNKKNKKKGRKKRKKENSIKFEIEEEYPDPENLDNTALSLEMKKYGMKPQNKKKNIEILKSVYNFLKIKEMPENILKKLTAFDCDNNDNNVSDNDNDNLIGSKSAENELNDETKKKIIELIKENKNIYEKILLFKEISIKEVKNILNAKGIIVPNNSLSQLLINSGVVLPGGWNNKK